MIGIHKKHLKLLNKSTGEEIQVPAIIQKHLFESKSLYQCVKVFYDFETLLVSKHIPANSGLSVHYSKEVLSKEN